MSMPFKLSLKLLEKLKPRYIHSHTYISVYASALDHTHATAKKVVYKWASSLWITGTVFITFKKVHCNHMCVQFSLVLGQLFHID